MLWLCFLLISGVLSETTTESDIITAPPENNTENPNKTDTQRIIQPSQSQQNIKLKFPPILNISAQTDVKNFKASPQLEQYYEFNRFPVAPAYPEPKIFGSVEKVPIFSTLPWEDKGGKGEQIRFPQTHPLTVNDHPYPYHKETSANPSVNEKTYLPPNQGGGGGGGGQTYLPYDYKKPITGDTTALSKPSFDKFPSSPYGDNWDKTLKKKPTKTFYEEGHSMHEMMESPWKKIIKMLTAFIPIGLLISALTPSVITIHPVNGTYGKARMEEKSNVQTVPPIGSSLLKQLSNDGCDERILCELLLSAEESKQSDSSVESLLDNYMNGKGNKQKLDRIYKAVKRGNCSTLHCDSIKKPNKN